MMCAARIFSMLHGIWLLWLTRRRGAARRFRSIDGWQLAELESFRKSGEAAYGARIRADAPGGTGAGATGQLTTENILL